MSSPAESAIATYESTRDAALQRVKDLLAIPTVSTDPAFAEDMKRGADWCANRLIHWSCGTVLRLTPKWSRGPTVIASWPEVPWMTKVN